MPSYAMPATQRPQALTLNDHGRRVVAQILAGERPHADLKAAFDWEATPEGHAYWSAQRNRPELSSSARSKLAQALAALPPPGAGLALVA